MVQADDAQVQSAVEPISNKCTIEAAKNKEVKPSFEGYSTKNYWLGKRGPHAVPSQPGPQKYHAEVAWRHTAHQQPKWTLGVKPDMVVGGVIPSWVNSIPGPKYNPDVDKYKHVSPAWSIPARVEYPGGPLALLGAIQKEERFEMRQAQKEQERGINQFGFF